MLSIGIQGTTDHVDTLQRVHGLAVLTSLQVHVVQTVLGVEAVHHTFLYRLHHNDRAVEVGFLIHIPDDPIHESPKEIAFSELNDLFWHHALRRKLFV